jgi:3-hydroxybutyryl-CoA dehydrogenase
LRKFPANNEVFLPKISMKVGVLANDEQKEELLLKQNPASIVFYFKDSLEELMAESEADALFILIEDALQNGLPHTKKPVFINSVIKTLKELGTSKNVYRINGWATFIKRGLWEVACEDEQALGNIMEAFQYQHTIVKDEPGFVAARVISMIINEAYYALEENVSTKEEIDIAMKLGTNYPYGPFEWAEKIGISNVRALLNKLSETDTRYTVCQALEKTF